MINKLIENISKVIVGKNEETKKILAAFISGGHVLIEDIPGVGKTSLSKSIASSIDLKYSRIQFTPDIMPFDVIGISIYSTSSDDFIFKPGAVFSNILLADEINRASPKTQSSLLEAMGEAQITVDDKKYELDKPFFVIATQNPSDYEGTFPLPEAQLDRFMIKVSLGYPSYEDELRLLTNDNVLDDASMLDTIFEKKELLHMMNEVKEVFIDKSLSMYILDIITKTRSHKDLSLGASPRASKSFQSIVKGVAYINDRSYVIPEDIIYIAKDVLAHRIMLSPKAKYNNILACEIIDEIIRGTDIPNVSIGKSDE
ncbi:MAG: MoxR family ATPase [Acidaminobacteraceae bacterium]